MRAAKWNRPSYRAERSGEEADRDRLGAWAIFAEMREILESVEAWRSDGERVAIATVVATWGSAPRRVGAKLALSESGALSGSVSGGCVESAVVEAGRESIGTASPRLLSFGVSDEQAWEVGLACGGSIEVLVAPLHADSWRLVRDAEHEQRAVATLTWLDEASLARQVVAQRRDDSVELSDAVPEEARRLLERALDDGRSQRVTIEGRDALIDATLPPPCLVIVGGVHIAQTLCPLARAMGYRTVVVDPRPAFGNAERFPDVDHLLDAWPDDALASLRLDSSTAVAVLTHDPKLDDPAFLVALRSRAFYIGALGSRRTQAKRRGRLLQAGISEAQLERLHAPIGLDLGGRAPDEIALSILAQIVAARHGKTGVTPVSTP